MCDRTHSQHKLHPEPKPLLGTATRSNLLSAKEAAENCRLQSAGVLEAAADAPQTVPSWGPLGWVDPILNSVFSLSWFIWGQLHCSLGGLHAVSAEGHGPALSH